MGAYSVGERTKAIIDGWRGLPGEFYMLKGLICLNGVLDQWAERAGLPAPERTRESELVSSVISELAIADRMGELVKVYRHGAAGNATGLPRFAVCFVRNDSAGGTGARVVFAGSADEATEKVKAWALSQGITVSVSSVAEVVE